MSIQKIMSENIGNSQALLLLNMNKFEEAIKEGNTQKLEKAIHFISEEILILKKEDCHDEVFFTLCQFVNKLLDKIIIQFGLFYIKENVCYDFQEQSRLNIENIKYEKRILSELSHQLKTLKKTKIYDSLSEIFALLFSIMSMHYQIFAKSDFDFHKWYYGIKGIQYTASDIPKEEDIDSVKQIIERSRQQVKLLNK